MKIVSNRKDYIPYYQYDHSLDCSINFRHRAARRADPEKYTIGFSLSANMAKDFGANEDTTVSIGEMDGAYFLVKDKLGYKMLSTKKDQHRLYVRIPVTEETMENINPTKDYHMVGRLLGDNIRIGRIE